MAPRLEQPMLNQIRHGMPFEEGGPHESCRPKPALDAFEEASSEFGRSIGILSRILDITPDRRRAGPAIEELMARVLL